MWTLANHHFQLRDGLDSRVCYSASAQTPTPACWKTKRVQKTTGKCSVYDDWWNTSR